MLFNHLLRGLTEEADWEPVFLERLTRMRAEDHPALPDYDEGHRLRPT